MPRVTLKRVALGVLGIGVIGFGAIQLIPYGRNHANPPVQEEPNFDSPATAAMVKAACYDCHSNRTQWPWYTNIAPISWLVQRDVDEGRAKLNFSEMNLGQPADESAEHVSEGEMPPFQYTIMHPAARLSDAQRQALIAGLLATFGGEAGESGGGD
jgi:mono/diheme cytochrome c family protein